MAATYELHLHPELADPVLVLALDGWIDAGLGAATATETLLATTDHHTVATFDTDVLLDHRARRPTLHLVNGVVSSLDWPALELKAVTDPVGNDFLLLTGAEPDHLWRAFADDVVGLALELGARLVLGLGAYPAPVPHTRPCRLVATASEPELAAAVGFVPAAIEVPAGAQAVVEAACAEAGIPACGLWAQVPHYAAAMRYPAAARALLEGLNRHGGLAVPTAQLPGEARAVSDRLDQLVGQSDDHRELLRQLEAQADAEAAAGAAGEPAAPGELPSGDELAAELQAYLRRLDPGDEGR